MNKTQDPAWWTSNETSTWDRMKEALRRDWEQTKNDFNGQSGKNLNQDVGDTVKQAAGKQAIPPQNTPNPEDHAWNEESAVRYGYGAGLSSNYHAHQAWDDDLETKLQTDWTAANKDRAWSDVRDATRFGWTHSRKSAVSKR